MYVQQDITGWHVCEDDGAILRSFRSKSAATRWMRDMQAELPTIDEVRGILKPERY